MSSDLLTQRLRRPGRAAPGVVDLDVRGVARVRLTGARAADVATIERQLGPWRAVDDGSADIEVTFVDELPAEKRLRYAGLHEFGFTEDEFVALRGPGGVNAPALLRLHRDPVEVVCRHGTPAVPFLVALINAAAVRNGLAPVHAAALRYRGHGLLVGGWAKGGKTETLLAFAAHGAQYVGDEWVYLDPARRTMSGLPEPMRVHAWQLRQLPRLWARLPARVRGRMRVAEAIAQPVSSRSRRPGSKYGAWLGRVADAARRRWASTRVGPDTLFGPEQCITATAVDHLTLAVSAVADMVTVEKSDPGTIAERLAVSARFERRPLMAAYEQLRFAFPGARSLLLEDLDTREAELIRRALQGTDATVVTHPHPVVLEQLFTALAPAVEGRLR